MSIKNKHQFTYTSIENYNPIILKYYLSESLKSLNINPSYVGEWINNGFEIRGRELYVEIKKRHRKRLRGSDYEAIVFCKIYIEDENGNLFIEDEIRGRFPINAYDKIAECVVNTIFHINLESILQNCIDVTDSMSEKGVSVKSIDDINDFIISDAEQYYTNDYDMDSSE